MVENTIETEKQPETAQETQETRTEVITTKSIPRNRRARKTEEAADVIQEARAVPKQEAAKGTILYCECGAALMPDKSGMYPHNCPECNEVCDYRGIEFLENSDDILVCAACGCLTKVKPDAEIKCKWCGAV